MKAYYISNCDSTAKGRNGVGVLEAPRWITTCEVHNWRQVLSLEMMCFYNTVLPCFGMAINHGLQSTAKRHLLLSASLVVGRDYSQNKVRTG